jgi:hypothetical protein
MYFAIRKLGAGECMSTDSWIEDVDLITRFETLDEAQKAQQSIDEDGYVEIVRIEIQIVEAELFDVMEIFEEAMR